MANLGEHFICVVLEVFQIKGRGTVVAGCPRIMIRKGDAIEFRKEGRVIAEAQIVALERFSFPSPPKPGEDRPIGIMIGADVPPDQLRDCEVWSAGPSGNQSKGS